jgi:glycerol uptake facilitator protein
MIGTFILVMGILFIGANEFTEGLNPLIIGFLILSIGLSLGGTTGYAINPARDLGPRIAHAFLPIAGKGNSDWSYSWIPVVGPVLGGIYGALFYNAVFKNQTNIWFWAASILCLGIVLIAIIKQLKEDQH